MTEEQDHSWVFGAVWLVFLVFPARELFMSDQSLVGMMIGVALLIVFAAVFVYGLVSLRCIGDDDLQANLVVLGMVAITSLMAILIGLGAMGMTAFIISYVFFAWPMRRAVGLAIATVVLVLVGPSLIGAGQFGEYWVFLLFLVPVSFVSALSRVMLEKEESQRELQEQLTTVAERDRIARDVHDILGHGLTVISVKAELAARLIDSDPDRAKRELAELHTLAREALAEVRSTVTRMRTRSLKEELLSARTALTAAGIHGNLPETVPEVRDGAEEVFAWAVREAVTNIIRHSGANRCVITLDPRSVAISDDGHGNGPLPEGQGLRGLRERAAAAGAQVDIAATQGKGTRVEVSVP
ncbi:two-component sensor histidine kinase [Hoyosella rhizosphaerae]|uniref:Two-component sensor histidine kinase n=2 Tax=Hoyosella rhizosphaerae TaxID=1755582 RepID=A0A916U3G5_9ACTN|nr:two-component sensor histidine kinase [Hoyosella rhizosphaerae]